jgi:hypothetical protein
MPVPHPPAAASPAAPHFAIGRDREGFWIAVETHGRGGGYFRSRNDALHYARFAAGRDPGAVSFVDGPLELRLC